MQRTKLVEYDCFRLAKPIPSEAISVGTIGVVLMVLSEAPEFYEVEFSDETGKNIGSKPTFTLSEDFLTPIEGWSDRSVRRASQA
jgi:hypothetical protein